MIAQFVDRFAAICTWNCAMNSRFKLERCCNLSRRRSIQCVHGMYLDFGKSFGTVYNNQLEDRPMQSCLVIVNYYSFLKLFLWQVSV